MVINDGLNSKVDLIEVSCLFPQMPRRYSISHFCDPIFVQQDGGHSRFRFFYLLRPFNVFGTCEDHGLEKASIILCFYDYAKGPLEEVGFRDEGV